MIANVSAAFVFVLPFATGISPITIAIDKTIASNFLTCFIMFLLYSTVFNPFNFFLLLVIIKKRF